jgi:peptide/nickel transport system substrate-binding protein
MDDLIEKIGVESDQAKRDAMIDEAARILQHDLPVMSLHQQVIVWAAKDKVDLAQLADNFFPYRYVRVK